METTAIICPHESFDFGGAGIYALVDPLDYHRLEACSAWRLMRLGRSPAHLRTSLEEPFEMSDKQVYREAMRMATFAPDRFDQRYHTLPEGINLRTNAGKAQRDALYAEVGQENVLKADDYEKCLRVAEAVRNHPVIARLLADAHPLLTVCFHYEGVYCKSRLDAWNPDAEIIFDLRITGDASKGEFQKQIWNFNYHRTAAFQQLSLTMEGFVTQRVFFIAAESFPPYGVRVYEIEGTAIRAGHRQNQDLIEEYANCLETGHWPLYTDRVDKIDLPSWAYRQL